MSLDLNFRNSSFSVRKRFLKALWAFLAALLSDFHSLLEGWGWQVCGNIVSIASTFGSSGGAGCGNASGFALWIFLRMLMLGCKRINPRPFRVGGFAWPGSQLTENQVGLMDDDGHVAVGEFVGQLNYFCCAVVTTFCEFCERFVGACGENLVGFDAIVYGADDPVAFENDLATNLLWGRFATESAADESGDGEDS